MNAEIISVGTELLLGQVVNLDTAIVAQELSALGIDLLYSAVVGDNVEQPQVMPIRDALRLADEMELDLIEISPKADPPVCRIADYQKFLYQQKKKAKELKANQVKVTVKEIRFGPQTDDHDYNFKLKHAMNFLKEGSKVKAYVFFRGRSIVFKEQGEILLLRFATDLEEVAKVEMMPKLDGKKMNMMLAPKSKK